MINIADKIWAVKAVGRNDLAYMCPYHLKRDGTPDSATAKMMKTGQNWADVGARTTYKTQRSETTGYIEYVTDADGKNVVDTHTPAQEGEHAVYDNVPMKGFKVGQDATRWTTDNKVFRLHDPRGFVVEIPTGNLSTLIQTCTIINGEIMDECVWGRDGCHVLLPINAPEYTKVVKEIEKVDESLRLKDLKPGDWVKLHQQGEEQTERQFVGMVKLEWTQHRQLFDREAYTEAGYYTQYREVNVRDDGAEVLKDSQWVGLFAAKVQTTRTQIGTQHGSQPIWKYSDYEPSVNIENNTAKITARREGHLPEFYKDLDNALSVISYNYYNDREKGRHDCPQRVHNGFAKQEKTSYNDTRVAGKDLTRAHFTAKVYKQA